VAEAAERSHQPTEEVILERLPERGVIEAKLPDRELDAIQRRRQVAKYLERYGKAVVTNYRAFRLLAREPDGDMQVDRNRDVSKRRNSACSGWFRRPTFELSQAAD
jgi:hypothetical protein